MATQPPPIPFSVDHRTAIVTGAGSGINFCFAKLLLSRNCNVVIADLGLRPEAQQLIDEHSSEAEGKPRAVFVKTDVTIWDHLTNMFDVAEKEFGGADIVCPGAGIFEPTWTNFWHPPGSGDSKDSVHGTDKESLGHYAILDINLTHPIRTTQIALSRWLNPSPDSKVGKTSPTNPKRIVHISSVAGQTTSLVVPLYHVSKHGLSAFIRSMGDLEMNIGVRVNGVAPGVIKTPLWTEHPEKMKMLDQERDKWVTPEEVAVQMLRCVEDDEIGAGTIWEVTTGLRKVGWRNDPGPQSEGASLSNAMTNYAEVLQWLGEPGWGVPKA